MNCLLPGLLRALRASASSAFHSDILRAPASPRQEAVS